MKLIPISLYDVAAQQAFLEDEARRGRFLTGYTGPFSWFERGEPKAVRYRLEPLRRRNELPDPDRLAAYRMLGWTYVTTVGRAFHVWRCDDPDAPELDTDPEVRASAYDYQRRLLRRANGLLAAVFLAEVLLTLWLVLPDPARFLERQVGSDQPLWAVLVLYSAALFALGQLLYWNLSFHRFVRTLRAGVPVPQRRPYRLSRCLAAVCVVLYGAFLLSWFADICRPNSRPFLTEAELGEAVPYVALADAGKVLALPWENWLTREQWWVLQIGAGDAHRAESHYYDLWLPALAEPLAQALRERDGLKALPPVSGLDGAWYGVRSDGLQVLVVRRDSRVMGVYYDGETDLQGLAEAYAALLAQS